MPGAPLSAVPLGPVSGRTAEPPGDQVIERDAPRPASNDHQKAGCPGAVRRPGIGIDENLDHQRHAEQCQRRQPACQADHEQKGKEMLAEGGDMSRNPGIDQRQFIFRLEEIDGIVGHMPALHLGLAGLPEDSSDRQPRNKRDQVMRNAVEQPQGAMKLLGHGLAFGRGGRHHLVLHLHSSWRSANGHKSACRERTGEVGGNIEICGFGKGRLEGAAEVGAGK